jgi:hypothetical protein
MLFLCNIYFLYIKINKFVNKAVFGSCYQWARKPQNYPITASYIDGLTPLQMSYFCMTFSLNFMHLQAFLNKVRRQDIRDCMVVQRGKAHLPPRELV